MTNNPAAIAADSSTRVSKSRGFRWMLLVLGLFAGLVTVLIMLWFYAAMQANARLDTQVARVRERGEPLTIFDYATFNTADDGRPDLTELLLPAFAKIESKFRDPLAHKLPFVGTGPEIPRSPEEWEQLPLAEEFLGTLEPELALFRRFEEHQATARYACDLSNVMESSMKHVQAMRSAERVLTLNMQVDLHRGRVDAAIENVLQQLALVRTVEKEPLFVNQMSRLASISRILANLQEIANSAEIPESFESRLQAAFSTIKVESSLVHVLAGERAFGYTATIDPNLAYGNSKLSSERAKDLRSPFPWTNNSASELIELNLRVALAADKSLYDALQEVAQIEAEFGIAANPKGAGIHPLNQMTLPALSKIVTVTARVAARRDAAKMALIAKSARNRLGRWPTTLQELVPDYCREVPTDPFTNQPMKMIASESEFKVYSVGVDRTDNLGALSDDPAANSDLGFIVTLANAAPEQKSREHLFPRFIEKLKDKQPVTVVCLGDSVTGVYYHTGGRRAYPEMLELALKQAYPDSPVKVINAGISGNSTVDALARLKRDALDNKPDLVTVMFGLNDMVRVPLGDYQANLKNIAGQCRDIGADVLFCTPNSVVESSGRPVAKLIEYCQALQTAADEQDIAVCDCRAAHEKLKEADPLGWQLTLSDAIHPNMDGHKLTAVAICESLTGRRVALDDIGPLQPSLVRTRSRIKAGERLRVILMEPLESTFKTAFQEVAKEVNLEISTWPTNGQTLSQIEEFSKGVREKRFDLVVLAIPTAVTPTLDSPSEGEISSYSWILNWSLSFGYQEWDVIGISTVIDNPRPTSEEIHRERFARRMFAAQDLTFVVRPVDSADIATGILAKWLQQQLSLP